MPSSSKKQLIQNTSLYFVITFSGKIIPFLIVPFMTEFLNPSQFGIAATYTMYVTIFYIFIGFELTRYIDVNYFKLDKNDFSLHLSSIISYVFVSSILVLIAVFIFSKFVIFPDINHLWIYIIPLAIVFKFINIVNISLLRNEENPGLYGVFAISETFLYSCLSLYLAWLLNEWTSKAAALIISMIVFGFFGILRLKNRYNLSLGFDTGILKIAFVYSIPYVIGLNLANVIFANSDKVILNYFYDYSEVGIFSIAFTFASIVGFVTDSFMKAWIPVFYTRLRDKDQSLHRKTFFVGILLVIVALISIEIVRFIMPFMINERFFKAIHLMPYIALLFVPRVFEQLLLLYINFYGKTEVLYGVLFISILTSVIGAYFLVEAFGVVGMAISMNLFIIIKGIYYFFIVRKLRTTQ